MSALKTISAFLVLSAFLNNCLFSQSVLFTKGSQNFPPVETFQVKLIDVDADGDPDAVCPNMSDNNSRIWLNDGNGLFSDSGRLLTKQGHGIDAADLNGDTLPDLFIPCAMYRTNSGQFNYSPSKIYFGDGSGNFIDSGQNLGDSLESKTFVDLVDYDCDNDYDAVVQHFSPPNRIYYKIYDNDGSGVLNLGRMALPDNSFPNWADLNSDGDVDIFLQNENEGYSVLLNDGSGNFNESNSIQDETATFNERSVNLNDFDNDGDIDAFVIPGSIPSAESAMVFLNDGTGNFTDTGQRLGLFNWCWVQSADIDKDNDADVIISSFGKPTQVWLNDGSGNFQDSGLRLGGNNSYHGFDTGDLDNDGDLDLFIAFFGKGSNEVWFNDVPTSVESIDPAKFPSTVELYQNYPNPFNPETVIEYYVTGTSSVNISVYNLLGEHIVKLVNEIKPRGLFRIVWNAVDKPSGIYFVRMTAVDSDGRTHSKILKSILEK